MKDGLPGEPIGMEDACRMAQRMISDIDSAYADANAKEAAGGIQYGDCPECAVKDLEIKNLREALEDLLDVQNGPPLIRKEAEWAAFVKRGWELINSAKHGEEER